MPQQLRAILFLLCTFSITHASVQTGNEDPNIAILDELGGNIEASIKNNSPSYLNGLINSDSLLANITAQPNNVDEQVYYESFKEGFSSNFDLGVSLYNEMGSEGSYTFLNAFKTEEKYHLLFRMIGMGGVNYHDFTMNLNGDEFAIGDIYNYFTGESMTEIMARMYTLGKLMIREPNADEIELLSNWYHYNKLNSFALKGKYKKAFKKWSAIPHEIKTNKNQLSLALSIAKHLDSESFTSVYSQFEKHYPESGAKYLMAMDALTMQGDLEQSLMCADSLSRYLYNDPVLSYLKANIYYALGDNEQTQDLLESVIQSLPDYESGYVSLLGLYLETKKYGEATALLDDIRYNFGSYKEDLRPLLVDYPDFLSSNEYAKWIEP